MQVGLFGKLPSHGDFLRRRTSDAFVAVWDAWLQECMSFSRSALGDRWLNVYLTSPAWRFGAAAGACGTAPVIGLMVPSVDRVGRYFPLAVVAELPAHVSAVWAVTMAGRFFERAERLLIETLAAEHIDFEGFDEQVAELAETLGGFSVPPSIVLEPSAADILSKPGERRWHVPIGASNQLGSILGQMLSHALTDTYDPVTLWWTDGSSIVEPSCLITSGLPDPRGFAALLEGSWPEHRWQSIPAQVNMAQAETPLIDAEAPLRYRSAASSEAGKVRTTNEDSYIEHSESGVWVVADGLGGHSDGGTASRMVCDAFADFLQHGSFEDTIAAARDRLAAVNEELTRVSARSPLADRSGSTVVVLLLRGSRCAVLWAGDSRAYRWRSGRLEQLTRDHSVGEDSLPGLSNPHAITRAVGANARLDLDICREQVRPGDRFLLCSDGLTRAVPDGQLRSWLESPEIAQAVSGLIEETLRAGAPDNVTALVVEAVPSPDSQVAGSFGLLYGNQ